MNDKVKPLITMAELAKMLGYDKSTKYDRALRFCRRLEQRKGQSLLIRLGGKQRVGRWMIPRDVLLDVLNNPLEPAAEKLEKAVADIFSLTRRVEELESEVFDLKNKTK